MPPLQVAYAEPVVGAAVSASATVFPAGEAAANPLQVLVPAVQVNVPAGHPVGAGGVGGVTAALHVVLYGVPHVPALHVAYAVPVVGAVLSFRKAYPPFAVTAAVAVQ